MLLITWPPDVTDYVDVLDWHLFARVGRSRSLRHRYVGPNGGEYIAICDMVVTSQEAVFDYCGYPQNQFERGLMKLVFSNTRRDSVSEVCWQDMGSKSWTPYKVILAEGEIARTDRSITGKRQRVERTYLERPEQQRLRCELLVAFQARCMITGCDVDSVLEVAHIRPITNDGPDTIQNALLLRSDIHRLFDRGLISIDVDGSILLSNRLNGSIYERELRGRKLAMPRSAVDCPSESYLEEHRRRFGFDGRVSDQRVE